jgi:hypothetical protein
MFLVKSFKRSLLAGWRPVLSWDNGAEGIVSHYTGRGFLATK